MMNDCDYDKTKLLHELSKLSAFIDRHAIEDAEKEHNAGCIEEFGRIKKDLDSHIESLKPTLAEISEDA